MCVRYRGYEKDSEEHEPVKCHLRRHLGIGFRQRRNRVSESQNKCEHPHCTKSTAQQHAVIVFLWAHLRFPLRDVSTRPMLAPVASPHYTCTEVAKTPSDIQIYDQDFVPTYYPLLLTVSPRDSPFHFSFREKFAVFRREYWSPFSIAPQFGFMIRRSPPLRVLRLCVRIRRPSSLVLRRFIRAVVIA